MLILMSSVENFLLLKVLLNLSSFFLLHAIAKMVVRRISKTTGSESVFCKLAESAS